ncbi:MAG: divalent metal cation transporter [Deltaproteobacteria bacterium]|nr:MAG: divalent metal cation transporter [Deltaproteobacteria bacterium]
MQTFRDHLRSLGPGLLWAGTAIGVSHLVQSTRAGAETGLMLLWLVIAANVFKYPAFEAGPRYAAATGLSLLEGYRRLGRWALVLFLGLTLATMFTVIAGVTLVTAGMASALFTEAIPVWGFAGGLLAVVCAVLIFGRYWLLDRIMKVMMGVLTLSTIVTIALVLPRFDATSISIWPGIPDTSPATLLFLCALAGWMPSALDIAVWHTLWGLEKTRGDGRAMTVREATFDFNVGYVGTALLACGFLLLGAIVLHPAGVTIPQSAPAFATTLVDVYAAALGQGARPLILIAVFSTMLSTTLSVSDGFPRALAAAIARLRGPERGDEDRSATYWVALGVCVTGAFVIILFFAQSMRTLVDLATMLTGLTAGAFAILNLLVLRRPEVPEAHRPSPLFTVYHLAGIGFLIAMGGLLLFSVALTQLS